jgi:hypothetical protein
MLIDTTRAPAMTVPVIDTVKINGKAPRHPSHTMEFGANVPNRLQRGQERPLRCSLRPGTGLAPTPVGLRILIAVHSWWVSSAEADEFGDRRFCA